MADSGVRSSWIASAANRRSRASLAARRRSARSHVAEHPVERRADLADLGPRVGVGDAGRQRRPRRSPAAARSPGSRWRRPGAAGAARTCTSAVPQDAGQQQRRREDARARSRDVVERVVHRRQRQPGDADVRRRPARGTAVNRNSPPSEVSVAVAVAVSGPAPAAASWPTGWACWRTRQAASSGLVSSAVRGAPLGHVVDDCSAVPLRGPRTARRRPSAGPGSVAAVGQPCWRRRSWRRRGRSPSRPAAAVAAGSRLQLSQVWSRTAAAC